jgi:hypothetical protein
LKLALGRIGGNACGFRELGHFRLHEDVALKLEHPPIVSKERLIHCGTLEGVQPQVDEAKCQNSARADLATLVSISFWW